MRILRAEDHRRMPWKNGAGETVEIAVFPAGASIDDFDWRISMASVHADGPFSTFPGVDRTLSILTGEGLVLSVEGRGRVSLEADAPPYSFPADLPSSAKLREGPVTDLNVMTRRGCFSHRVTRHDGQRFELHAEHRMLIALCLSPLGLEGRDVHLQALDAIILDPGEVAVLAGTGDATVFIVELDGLGVAG